MIGLAGLIVFGFSALWLMAAGMSDAPSEADGVAQIALIGVGIGFVLMLVQFGLWLWRVL